MWKLFNSRSLALLHGKFGHHHKIGAVGQQQPLAGVEIVKAGDEAIRAGWQAVLRQRQGEGIDHDFTGRPAVRGVEAVEGLAVPAADDLAVLVEQLEKNGVGFGGGLEGLPVEGDGQRLEIGVWRLEIGGFGEGKAGELDGVGEGGR